MKFPKLTDLDGDQKAIYSGAPPTESILVIGPPGTGKTVMAFHRAAFLDAMSASKRDKTLTPVVIMYSKVLQTYTAARERVAENVGSSTMHSWVYGWWKRVFRMKPPMLPADEWQHDWGSMLQALIPEASKSGGKVHWGHLIIDEGQDFPRDMYATLKMVASLLPREEGNSAPAISVFADENQRLSPNSNSTIEEIVAALALTKSRVYWLRKNYRNSRQIAEFARHYYVGLPSGIPDVPARLGTAKPRLVLASALETVRRRIAAYAMNNSGSDVGVLCMREAMRKQVFNSLSSRLSGTDLVVQTYSNKVKAEHPPEKLQFDKGGSVTVLNCQSAKGLEFDAVFLVDPFSEGGGATEQQANMLLYVTASRARDYLEILVMNPPVNLSARLPSVDLYEKIEE